MGRTSSPGRRVTWFDHCCATGARSECAVHEGIMVARTGWRNDAFIDSRSNKLHLCTEHQLCLETAKRVAVKACGAQ